jgi:hypothetical protein
MKRVSFQIYSDCRGNEYSHAFICLGVPDQVSPHLIEDNKFHLLDDDKKLGISVCDECLNLRKLKRYPK